MASTINLSESTFFKTSVVSNPPIKDPQDGQVHERHMTPAKPPATFTSPGDGSVEFGAVSEIGRGNIVLGVDCMSPLLVESIIIIIIIIITKKSLDLKEGLEVSILGKSKMAVMIRRLFFHHPIYCPTLRVLYPEIGGITCHSLTVAMSCSPMSTVPRPRPKLFWAQVADREKPFISSASWVWEAAGRPNKIANPTKRKVWLLRLFPPQKKKMTHRQTPTKNTQKNSLVVGTVELGKTIKK